jgi:hypothetical protein
MMRTQVIAKQEVLQVQALPVECEHLNVRGPAKMCRQGMLDGSLVDSGPHQRTAKEQNVCIGWVAKYLAHMGANRPYNIGHSCIGLFTRRMSHPVGYERQTEQHYQQNAEARNGGH